MDIVVCYDVTCNRRRARLMRRLREHLRRVQKSVFEGEIAEDKILALRAAIVQEIDPNADTVRIYHFCARCVHATELFGVSVFVDRGDSDEIV